MRLTNESPRTRLLILLPIWIVAAVLLFAHARLVRQYLDIAGGLGLRGAGEPTTPLQQVFPAFAADAQTWVRHALSLLEGDQWRLRYTTIDNAPDGREVHWNSAWAWTIAIAGWLDHWLAATPLPKAVERMTVWLNPFVLTALIIIISRWAANRGGVLIGAIVAIAMAGHPRIFEGFFPSYVDHHGLLAVAVLGLMLGATFMGAGWWQESAEAVSLLPRSPESARSAATVSAIFGAVGLWVSAASAIPPVAIVGVAGLAAVSLNGRAARAAGQQFDGDVWRTWGRTGAIMSFVFYLVEYFPNHLGLRLEANHPFYSLAWWGGGEIIAQLGECRVLGQRFAWRSLAWALAAVLVAPVTILIGGSSVFLISDKFLARLHHDHIQEFQPLWRTISGTGWKTFFEVVGFENLPLIIAVGCLIRFSRRLPIVLWFTIIAAFAFTAMAWMQSRWLLNASGAQVCVALTLLAFLFRHTRPVLRIIGVAVSGLVLFSPGAITRITGGMSDVAAKRVSPKDAHSALSRDIAAVLRRSQPTGEITLLTSPNSSTMIGYYGRFKTLGTLYWENTAGLKAAGAILAAKSADEAAQLIRKHKVTHVAIVSEENFIEQYYGLLNPGAPAEEVRKCFGLQLLVDRRVPPWLQMIPYRVPDDFGVLNTTVMLFKVAFEQTSSDALYHIALSKVELGMMAEAEEDFDTLTKMAPDAPEPWLRKSELLMAKQEWDAAVTAALNGINRARRPLRMQLFANIAFNFHRNRQYSQAVRLYRAALEQEFNPEIAAYLAFVLSTASDAHLRNGKEAVELAEKAVAQMPKSITVLNSLAAAYAEAGRFNDAVKIAEHALANARFEKNTAGERITEKRIIAYKAGQPWRE
jgi:tetratricopeptide (TPR) repeat protein